MILVSDIVSRITSALDSEGFDQYLFDQDFKYAISYATEYCCSILDRILGKNRYTDERLSDLLYTRVWKTNNRSSFVFNETEAGKKLWAITVIHMDPVTYLTSSSTPPVVIPNVPIPQPDLNLSVYAPNYHYIKSYKSCYRITSQEADQNRRGYFSPGSERYASCPDLIEYGYLSPSHYGGAYQTDPDAKEIYLSPDYNNQVVAMQFVAYPDLVVSPTQQIGFPASMMNMIVNKSLEFLSFKRGDTNLTEVSEMEVKQLTSLLQ